jgi:hypothetical protein
MLSVQWSLQRLPIKKQFVSARRVGELIKPSCVPKTVDLCIIVRSFFWNAGWWFGTFLIFPNSWDETTNQNMFEDSLLLCLFCVGAHVSRGKQWM